MKRMPSLARVVAMAFLVVAPSSRAFEFQEYHWDVDPCKSSSCSITSNPFLELCGNNNSTGQRQAASWAFWNWCREGSLSLCHYWYTEQCKTGSNWYGDDDWNEFDFVQQVNAIGDRGRCLNSTRWYSYPFIWTSDIKIRDVIGNFYQSLTVDQCLTLGPSSGLTFAHEVGHAYGLSHDDTYAFLMNGGTNSRRCSMGTGWREQPDGDSMAGAVELYGRNTNNIFNLTGAAYYRPVNGVDTIDTVSEGAYCSKSQAYSFTLMNVYKEVPALQYAYRFVLTNFFEEYPTVNDVVWFGPLSVHSPSGRNTTVRKNVSVTVPHSVMLHGQVYRLWVWVDPTNYFSETDEQDNWIPLNTIFIRASSC